MNKQFWKRNSSTILTVLGGVGVVATAVMTAKATPKAMRLIEEAKEEKGEELSKWETIKTAGTAYIPAIVIGAATVGCIFGANILNKRHQAALVSAYALLDQTHKDYKNKVVEMYGDEAAREIRENLAKDQYDEDLIDDTDDDDNKQLFYDEYSRRYFRATTEEVLMAEYELNRMLVDDYCVTLNDFYYLLDIPKVDYGDQVGWSASQMYDMYWSSWIHFNHEKFDTDDGLEGNIIIFTEPMVDFDKY